MKNRLLLAITFGLCTTVSLQVSAAPIRATPVPAPVATPYPTPTKKPQLPKSGVLSSISSGNRGESTAAPWGLTSGTGSAESKSDSVSPISGSVSRLDQKTWNAVVVNSAKVPYSASLAVEQLGQRGNVVKSDSFSYTMKPGAKETRTVSAASTSVSARLVLRSWKKLGKDPEELEEERKAAEQQKALAKKPTADDE